MFDVVIKGGTIVDGTGGPRFAGDVGIIDGRIAEVGEVEGRRRTEIDADGAIVTPGFVDVHTHFDGQVCWDKQVTPTSWHGVTTVVMGNCGVGFAPVRPGSEETLVKIMEAVEDIPGTALSEGITWGWESFPEYLDAIDTPYALDVATHVPHVALRYYVMGERCYDPATPHDIEKMRRLTREGLEAGALGFSTSRFMGHRDYTGREVPGTYATPDEMRGIGEAFVGLGHGVLEVISDHVGGDDEIAWIEDFVRVTHRPITVLPGAGPNVDRIWDEAARLNAEGFRVHPQVGARPTSMLMGLEASVHPLMPFEDYRVIRSLPLEEQVALLRSTEFRARILAAKPKAFDGLGTYLTQAYDNMFPLGEDLSYEPSPSDSVAAIAAREHRHVMEVVMDTMAAGETLLFIFGRYPDHNLDQQRSWILDERSLLGLGDGGAHCGLICDSSVPTYMLSYWSRDRTRGERLPLEFVVKKQTHDTARAYSLDDRGVIAPGFRADLNVIDYEGLRLSPPTMVHDLPAGGRRLVQKAVGYAVTMCAGQVTFVDGEFTGSLPGRLVRGAQMV